MGEPAAEASTADSAAAVVEPEAQGTPAEGTSQETGGAAEETREEAPGTTAPPAGETDGAEGETTASEGETKPEGETEGEGTPLEDDAVIQIGEEEIPFGALRQAYEERAQAQKLIGEANAAIGKANTIARGWLENFEETGLIAFTRAEKGDQERGYQRFVRECARVVDQHLQWEGMSAEAKQAVIEKRRADAATRELESYRAREREKEARATEARETNAAREEITRELKAAGILPSDKLQLGRYLGRVSNIWLWAKEEGGKEISVAEAVAEFKRELDAFRKAEREALKKENVERAKVQRSGQVNAKTGAEAPRPSEDRQPIVYDPADFSGALARAR